MNQLVAASPDPARPLRRSTISDKLRGRSLPEWDFVAAFVGACRSHAENVGSPLPDELVDLATWDRAHWEMLRAVDASLADERLAAAAKTEIVRRGDAEPAVQGHALPAMVPRQLPAAARHFSGRKDELARLTAFAAAGARAGTLRLVAIEGSAGIGKTALALHWGNRMSSHFPDGQLYVNLQGADPSGCVVTADDAVYRFLEALSVATDRIPTSLAGRSALYRSVLADRQVLIVLDNARDAEHVRPLLPGAAQCLVVVTSRSRLTSLVATEGAYSLTLDLFSPKEAGQFLSRTLGQARLTREPRAVANIVAHCAGLPLALSIVAARAAARPAFTLAVLSEELDDANRRLDALDGGDSATNIRSVLSWSYRNLSPDTARLFRLLGLHRGPDIDPAATASLAGVPVPVARSMLLDLSREYLVTEHKPNRFSSHDLLRVYAAELVYIHDSDRQRRAATFRLLDHYLRAAVGASLALYPHRRDVVALPTAQPDVVLAEFADHDQALNWLTAQLPVLLLAIRQAVTAGLDTHANQLACAVAVLLARQGRWPEIVSVEQVALDAARRMNDGTARAHAHRNIGLAAAEMGDHATSGYHYRCALDLFDALSDRAGAAHTHLGLSRAMDKMCRYGDALAHAKQATDLYEAAADPIGQANALNSLGWCYTHVGDGQQALAACEAALILAQKTNNRWVESAIWDSLGRAHKLLGEPTKSRAAHQNALDICREIGDRPHEADTLVHIGEIERAMGNTGKARAAWRAALAIRTEINHPDADEVRRLIEQL